MFPLRDSVRSSSFPVVNVCIIAVNAFVFLYQISLGTDVDWMINKFGLIPDRFFQYLAASPPDLPGVIIPTISSVFLHGGWMHFIGNMWYLWIFGDNVEDCMGHGRYLLFYLLCGVGAGLIHVYFNQTSVLPTVGASGAIAGIMGAYMLMYPKGKVLTFIPIFFFVQIPAVVFLIIWIAIQAFQGLAAIGSSPDSGGVAWWAHIGGFVVGMVFIFLFRRRNF